MLASGTYEETALQDSNSSRRHFLASAGGSLGAAWLAASWPAILEAHAHAAATDSAPPTYVTFAPGDARDVDAIAGQIVPTDDTPGAREVGTVLFIDRSLHTWAAAAAAEFRSGLRDFQSRFAARHAGLAFADADGATQIGFLEAVDQTPFFGTMWFMTLLGMFSLPEYGGNRDGAGWRLIGFEDKHAFTPPFGYYDRDYAGFALPKEPA
jgi:gluconate 2-dehydrogenase gamma chain